MRLFLSMWNVKMCVLVFLTVPTVEISIWIWIWVAAILTTVTVNMVKLWGAAFFTVATFELIVAYSTFVNLCIKMWINCGLFTTAMPMRKVGCVFRHVVHISFTLYGTLQVHVHVDVNCLCDNDLLTGKCMKSAKIWVIFSNFKSS